MYVELDIPTFEVDFGVLHELGTVQETYKGECSVTPKDTEQTLETEGKVLLNNITIAPIPKNYGKISWNGATLTVK